MKKYHLILLLLLLSLFQESNALVVLQYHHVSETTPESTSLSPQLFEQHLDYLSENNFRILNLEKVIQLLKSGKSLPEKSVLITFDDGYRSIYETAFPILKKKGMPFTVFVNTQPIKQQLAQFMDWRELRELIENKASIANHTQSHPYLIRRLKNESEKQWSMRVRVEISDAQAELKKHLGTDIKALAYPYGEYDSKLEALVNSLGYIAFGQHSGAISKKSSHTALPRFPFAGDYGEMDDFIQKVNSFPLPIENAILLDENNKLLADHRIGLNVETPQLFIELERKYHELNLQCYLSGAGEVIRTKLLNGWRFQSSQNLPMGRSRYNCTAFSEKENRLYWYSQPWIKTNEQGHY